MIGWGQLPVDRVGIELVEFVDVVALAGVVASGEGGQVPGVVNIVLPQPVVVHGDVGVPLHQAFPLLLRHHAEGRRDALLHAPRVNLVQGGVHVALPRQGDGEVKHAAIVGAVVEHNETAVGLGEFRMPVLPPHELHAQGVLAQAVGALAVIFAQEGGAGFADGFEFQHKISCSLSLLFE